MAVIKVELKIRKISIENKLLFLMILFSLLSNERTLHKTAYRLTLSIVLVIGLILFLVSMLDNRYSTYFYMSLLNNKWIIVLSILILISQFSSSISGGAVSLSSLGSIIMIILSFYMFYIHIPKIVLRDWRNSTKTLINLITLLSILAIIIKVRGSFFGYSLIYGRAASIFFDPNYFGTIAAVGLTLESSKIKRRNITKIINLIALILSGSRGAMLSFGIVFLVFFFYRKKISFKNIIFFTMILILSGFILVQLVKTGIFRTYQGISGRDKLWNAGFELIKNKPILGIGYGSSGNMFNNSNIGNSSSHNGYIDYIISNGLLAFTVYSIIIIKGIVNGHRTQAPICFMRVAVLLLINANTITITLGGIGATSMLLTLSMGVLNANDKIKGDVRGRQIMNKRDNK